MPRILIAEGNTPELLQGRTEAGLPWTAEAYGAALAVFDPEVEVTVTRPYFDGWDLDALDMAGFDGLAVTGSGVSWSGADARARPFWALYEKAFAASVPALGCCWGMQTAAVVLGGDTAAGPNGVEAGFARGVTLTEAGAAHPLHAGRARVFDVLCMHRDDVTRLPEGAVVTASNAHTEVQGMVYEQGGTRFWGLQYHPEITLHDVAWYFQRSEGAFAPLKISLAAAAAELTRIAEAPAADPALSARYGIDATITDRQRHGVELGNWLRMAVAAPQPAED
ncbi:MAG: type 1 glutamine amidotransferase [Pseudomonadota bacterium]